MVPIKYISFEKSSKICKDFKGTVGLYDPNKDVIYIDSSLPKPRQRRVLWHERAHRMIFLAGARDSFPGDTEEVFCDIWEIVKSPDKSLSYYEAHIKKRILNGFRWTNNKEKILRAILKECGITPSQALIVSLL